MTSPRGGSNERDLITNSKSSPGRRTMALSSGPLGVEAPIISARWKKWVRRLRTHFGIRGAQTPAFSVPALAIALSACAGIPDQEETIANLENGSISLVVIDSEWYNGEPGPVIDFVGAPIGDSTGAPTSARFSVGSKDLFRTPWPSVVVVKPGRYAVESLRARPNITLRTQPWNRQTGRPKVFGFEIAPSEVLYLGHIRVDVQEDQPYLIGLRVKERREEAVEAVSRRFGARSVEILNRMEVRLIEVPPVAW